MNGSHRRDGGEMVRWESTEQGDGGAHLGLQQLEDLLLASLSVVHLGGRHHLAIELRQHTQRLDRSRQQVCN